MSIMNKYVKGQYEYARYRRMVVLIVAIIMFAISASLYIGGYIATKSNKNLLTIVAVLGMLPACKSLVSVIMHFRVKIQTIETKKEIDSVVGKLNGLYHIYFTSAETNYYIAHCVVTDDSFIGYTDDTAFDGNKFYEHIEKHMKIDGINNILVKVFTDKKSYLNRLKQLNELENAENTNAKMYELVQNISL